jgi:hypothetical protein
MSTKHTPGPWRVTSNSWEVSTVYSTAGEVARCYIDSEVTEDTQDQWGPIKEANARLIASAPELLKALQDLMSDDGLWDDMRWADCCDNARDAIAKATGSTA